MMNILFVSAYPPPIGGVTIHVQRLFLSLQNAGNQVRVFDYLGNHNPEQDSARIPLPSSIVGKVFVTLQIAKLIPENAIVHFHVSAFGRFKWIGTPLLFLFWRQLKVITIHSGSFVEETNKPGLRLYIRWLLLQFNHIITVNIEQAEYLKSLGIKSELISVIPAFLPTQPIPRLLPESIAQIPRDKIIILTSGYLTPLYNYDVLIDCIERLDKQNYVFIFAFYNEFDPFYESHIYQRLEKAENVIFLRNQPSDVFVTVMERCNIYVRTTVTDGDAVAIREAIYFGKDVFATDCVRRPDECLLFSQKDSSTLLTLFHEYQVERKRAIKTNKASNFSQILQVYQNISQAYDG